MKSILILFSQYRGSHPVNKEKTTDWIPSPICSTVSVQLFIFDNLHSSVWTSIHFWYIQSICKASNYSNHVSTCKKLFAFNLSHFKLKIMLQMINIVNRLQIKTDFVALDLASPTSQGWALYLQLWALPSNDWSQLSLPCIGWKSQLQYE